MKSKIPILIGVQKYGFYEKEIFHKERKEFRRTLRRIFKRVNRLKVPDSKIKIINNYFINHSINWRNPTIKLVYKNCIMEFKEEDLYTLYNYTFSNKFSGRFHPFEFFQYVKREKMTEEERDWEKRRRRKRIVDGKCEYCGNEDPDQMESLIYRGKIYFRCTKCRYI